ncbi:MAG: TrkA family potassium uptake protein [Candidatus Woesearchaeota archaeon]
MKVIIVGAGEIGKTVANMLSTKEHDITIVEIDEKTSNEVANSTEALVIQGDGTDITVLKDSGLQEADAVIATTNDDKVNLMVSEIAKDSNVSKIIARVNDPKNEELFTKLDITGVIPIVGMVATSIRNMLMGHDTARVLTEIGSGAVQVVAIKVQRGSKAIGETARISLGIIGTIYREGGLIIPKARTKIKEEDVLIITAKTEDIPKIKKQMSGE